MGIKELLEGNAPVKTRVSLALDELLAEDKEQWITIHPNGEEDYRRIQIDDQTGEILKGGAVALQGTNIRDFGKNMSNKTRVKGMSFKTVEEYRETEEKLKNRLKQAEEAKSRNEFEEADKISKGHKPTLIQRTTDKNKTSEWLDMTTHHKDMLEQLNKFSETNKRDAREFYDKKEAKEQEKYLKIQNNELNERKAQGVKDNPLKNEKMEKDVDKFNEITTNKFKELNDKTNEMRKIFKNEQDSIRDILDKKSVKDLTDKELSDLASRCLKIERKANDLLEDIKKLKAESHAKFSEITQSKTKNQGRYHHYLKNLKYGTDLGDFAFNATPKNYPHDVQTKGGQNIYTMLMHERNRRWRNN